MNMIRKGQIRWLPKNNIAGQAEFVSRVLGMVTAAITGDTDFAASRFKFATQSLLRPFT